MKNKLFLFTLAAIFISMITLIGYSRFFMGMPLSAKDSAFAKQNAFQLTKEISEKVNRHGRMFSSWFAGNLNRSLVPSAAAGVIKGEKLIFHSGVHADRNTRFGIASLSKTFTSVLVLKLAEKGKLSLDDPVRKHLPQVVIERNKLKSEPVTIRHLLAHTSGMPSYGREYKSYKVNDASIQLPRQVYPAGYCYAYSNGSYVLVMHIIEAVTGISYSENIKLHILDPLGMTSSTANQSNGTGGIITTINDLAKYASMLINRGKYRGKAIISKASYNEMLAKPVELPTTKVDYHYSLSWEVITVNQQIDSYYKAGRWHGEASGLQVFPGKKIAFIYLCNPPRHLTKPFMAWRQSLTGRLRTLVRNIADDQKLCTQWPYLNSKELKWYEGNYLNGLTGEKVEVFFKSNRLYSNKFGVQPLRPFTSNRFLIGTGRMLHNFVWKDKKVIGLALKGGYYRIVQ